MSLEGKEIILNETKVGVALMLVGNAITKYCGYVTNTGSIAEAKMNVCGNSVLMEFNSNQTGKVYGLGFDMVDHNCPFPIGNTGTNEVITVMSDLVSFVKIWYETHNSKYDPTLANTTIEIDPANTTIYINGLYDTKILPKRLGFTWKEITHSDTNIQFGASIDINQL